MEAISHPSLIKGVFRELAALRRPVQIDGVSFRGTSRISIADDFSRSNLDENSIRFLDVDVSDASISVSFELDSVYYQCRLESVGGGLQGYHLPAKLEPLQKRRRVRTDIQTVSRSAVIVEVRGSHWRAYGYLKNSDESHISVLVTTLGNNPQTGDEVNLRAFTEERQVLSTGASIRDIRAVPKQGQIELLLTTAPLATVHRKPRQRRAKIDGITHLELFWPNAYGLRIRTEVLETTPTGFSCRWIGQKQELPPKGAVCRIGDSEILAQLQWRQDDRIGFNLDLNTRDALALWSSWVDEWQLKVLNRTPLARQNLRIASVLIRSGYLRDFKASAFASTPDLLSLIPNNNGSRSWLKRFLRGTESEIDAHVSFARCTDTSWIIQELGNSAVNARHGEMILRESIETFHAQEHPYTTIGSTMLALFDPTSKFNQAFWMTRENLEGLNVYEGRLIAIPAALKEIEGDLDDETIKSTALVDVSTSNWSREHKDLLTWLPERTLLGFGLRSDDFTCVELRQALTASGYFMDRKVYTLRRGDQQIGLAVALGVPTFSNLNATSSHLWLIVRRMEFWKAALWVVANAHRSQELLGTTEAVVISPSSSDPDQLAVTFSPGFSRRRRLMFVPIHRLPAFLSGEGEPQ